MGTEAREAASAAERTRRPELKVICQGKTWIIRGERLSSAALITPRMCSML